MSKTHPYRFTDLEPNSPDEKCLLSGLECRIVRHAPGPASDCVVEILASFGEIARVTGLTYDEALFCFDPDEFAPINDGYPMVEAYMHQLEKIWEPRPMKINLYIVTTRDPSQVAPDVEIFQDEKAALIEWNMAAQTLEAINGRPIKMSDAHAAAHPYLRTWKSGAFTNLVIR